ncbi:MAG: 8-oxo-dGTP diphosphatase [Candidatus Paceibacterota bacterium]
MLNLPFMKLTTLCFPTKDGKILLSLKKRGFGKGFLNGYGGKAQEGEMVELAAIRELSEEAGIDANQTNLEKAAIIDFFDGDNLISECHVFFVAGWQGEPVESDEMAKPEWFDRESMPYDRMWKADREWLPLIFSGKKIHGKAYYTPGMAEFDRFEYVPL